MKKLMILLITLLMLSSVVSATDVQVTEEPVGFFENIFRHFGSGTLAVTDIENIPDTQRGASIDAYYYFKATIAGGSYVVTPAFITNDGATYIGAKVEKPIAHEVGDVWKVHITNFNTNIIPEKYCNTYVKLAGKHQVEVLGNLVQDRIQTARTYEQDSSNFLLKCGTKTCTAKDTGVFRCDTTSISGREILQTGYVTDSCYEGYRSTVCNVGYACNSVKGICEQSTTPTKLKNNYPCAGNDAICESGMCVAGLCKSSLLQVGGICIDNGDCTTSKCVNNVCTAVTTTNTECKDGEFEREECPDGSFINTKQCINSEWIGITSMCSGATECEAGSIKVETCTSGFEYAVDCVEGVWGTVDEESVCITPCTGAECTVVSAQCEFPEKKCGGVCEECGWWTRFIEWLKAFIGGSSN